MNKERRNFIKSVVLDLLQKYGELSLPIPVKKITKTIPNCRLIPYSRFMKEKNLSCLEMIMLCETEDACTDYYANRNQYIIYYNDVSSTKIKSNRYRWNIAHELGHILLNHHIDNQNSRIFRSCLTEFEYNVLEEEADLFASYLLVPHAVLFYFYIKSTYDIRDICKISQPAASRRFNGYVEWRNQHPFKDEYDKKIRRLFFLSPVNQGHLVCSKCGSTVEYFPDIKCCKICGNKRVQYHKEIHNMIYHGPKTDETRKLKICPRCGNEEIDSKGNYCKICGLYLLNDFINAPDDDNGYYNDPPCIGGVHLPSNARFCPYCGNPTTFLQNGILLPWDKTQKELNPTCGTSQEDDLDIPF